MGINKKGKISVLVEILIILIVVFLFWGIVSGGINKAFDSAINPAKKWLNLDTKEDIDKQKEAERVGKELQDNAIKVSTEVESVLNKCIKDNPKGRNCLCGTVDFTRLNDYNLKITNEGGNQVLELLDSRKVSIAKRSNMGSFLFGPLFVGSAVLADTYENYKLALNFRYTLISREKIIFNKDGIEHLKFFSTMEKVNFIKPIENVVFIDELNYGLKKCSS